jgi:XTP/dITP diphosphohydrolase
VKVVLASHNRGKLAELAALVAPVGWELTDAGALEIPAPDETRPTFLENALDKARHVAQLSGLPALADDSGLVVPALGGAPGIHSARYAGPGADAAANNSRLLKEIHGLDSPACYFYCVLVYLRHATDPAPVVGTGIWHGRLVHAPRGTNGFGYDPLFLVPEFDRTAAELDPGRKNRMSHRARAMTDLLGGLRQAGELTGDSR